MELVFWWSEMSQGILIYTKIISRQGNYIKLVIAQKIAQSTKYSFGTLQGSGRFESVVQCFTKLIRWTMLIFLYYNSSEDAEKGSDLYR